MQSVIPVQVGVRHALARPHPVDFNIGVVETAGVVENEQVVVVPQTTSHGQVGRLAVFCL